MQFRVDLPTGSEDMREQVIQSIDAHGGGRGKPDPDNPNRILFEFADPFPAAYPERWNDAIVAAGAAYGLQPQWSRVEVE